MGTEIIINRCYNCKFYQERRSRGLFGSVHKYWVCDNPKTVHQKGETWWNDGSKIALPKDDIDEILVGCNFGCVNWEKSENE